MRTHLAAVTLLLGAAALTACSTQDAAVAPSLRTSSSAGSSSTPSSTASPLEDAQRTNNFYLFPGNGVTSVGYAWDGSYSITPDQQNTWGGVSTTWTTTTTPASQAIVAKAGRQMSSEVYTWFAQRAPVSSCTQAGKGVTCSVTVLNFAFSGTLTINGKAYPITVGQGPDNGNAWFYGGAGWTGQGAASFVTPDGAYALTTTKDTPVDGVMVVAQ
ncbi:MAG: hypothetical protein WCP28_15360 [Actinomycetes bacterium]